MKTKPEQDVQSNLLKALRERGGWWIKTQGSVYSLRGVPDVIGCYEGALFAFEVKAEKGRLTKLQRYQLEAILQAGGYPGVVYGKDGVTAALEYLDKTAERIGKDGKDRGLGSGVREVQGHGARGKGAAHPAGEADP